MIFTLTLNPAIDRELTVAEIKTGQVLTALSTRVDVGGKGFNVSRMLQSFEQPSVAVAYVGGKTGQRLQAGLAALGIETDFVWLDGETRTNISIVAVTQHEYIKINEGGPEVNPAQQEQMLEKIRSRAGPGDWWVLAGSLPPGVDDGYYARIIRLLNERGATTFLDTTGEALRQGCREQVFMVKPNASEAEDLTGMPVETPEQAVAAAAAIREMGAQNVVISLGSQGAVLQTAGRIWTARPPQVIEKNPIGAGDSMVGAMVWALSRGLPMDEALRWGVASGAAAAGLSGTDIGAYEQISDLRQQVRCELFEVIFP